MTKTLVPVLVSLAMLSGGTFLAMERPEWLPGIGKSDKVLVFLVGSRSGVDRVRAAVDPARIVAATPDGIALREGRIVAVDAEAVSAPFTEAGWIERDIEIFHVEKNDGLKRSQPSELAGDVDPERLARLRDLVNKPMLSAGEQLFVLQAMNDGIAF